MNAKVSGQLIDLHRREIYPAEIDVTNGVIARIRRIDHAPDQYILPGFIDAHIHIESSMVVPHEFARIALTHGTVATVSDPHEIANVLGIEGVYYMIENARDARLKFHFGAPSCVPATSFETAGAELTSTDVKRLLEDEDIYYLSEMMNYPGVLNGDEEVLRKIRFAQEANKPVDGHAPGLMGKEAERYINAGISTDHECFTIEEAQHKLALGMRILIREGSAAKNYQALHPLIASHPEQLMFCSDDKHPDDLMVGHINLLVQRSLQLGYDLFDVLRIACMHPVLHYNLPVGLLREGDTADFVIVKNITDFHVREVYIDGARAVKGGEVILEEKNHKVVNQFNIGVKSVKDFAFSSRKGDIPVIEALDGEIVTERGVFQYDGAASFDQEIQKEGLQKIGVINRYKDARVSVGLIKNFNLREGAIASTVAHDSHNIIAVGADDASICQAVNLLIKSKGGLSAVNKETHMHLALPIVGLMSDRPCSEVAQSYATLEAMAKKMGCTLTSPYMTLSFMALLVIPKLKISDLGMFDVELFEFANAGPTS